MMATNPLELGPYYGVVALALLLPVMLAVLATMGYVYTAAQFGARLVAVLERAGCTLADVVKATVWLDDARDFGAFNKVYAEYFGAAPPARSTLVSPLVIDGKVEIELVAYKPLA